MTWATFVPILVFLGLPVLDLGPMYATDVRRQTYVRSTSSLNAPAIGAGIIMKMSVTGPHDSECSKYTNRRGHFEHNCNVVE